MNGRRKLENSWTHFAEAHLRRLVSSGTDRYGRESTAMWMSSLDAHTGRYPEDDSRPEEIGKRVYRNIDAPKGSSLYWDQPQIAAAVLLSDLTGDASYRQAVTRYVRDFLGRCVAANGVFLWGNHYYYDAFRDSVVRFVGTEDPVPVDLSREEGELYETRPIPPAWEILYGIDPEATVRCMDVSCRRSLFDEHTGGFNRHADGRKSCAFLESGGILAETLCRLASWTGDASYIDTALRVASFSYEHRNLRTGLLENNPTQDRWDKLVTTTEVGLWAARLLRAADLSGREELSLMADAAVSAFLSYAWDEKMHRYYGRISVADGSPVLGDRSSLKQAPIHVKNIPGEYSDLWEPLFPAHDYPMALAECCLSLHERTGKAIYAEAIERWVQVVRSAIPARGGSGGYAEHYGRCIRFLHRASMSVGGSPCRQLAETLASEAVDKLFVSDGQGGMFRGHPGEDRYDAVDGVGYLLLALVSLDGKVNTDSVWSGF